MDADPVVASYDVVAQRYAAELSDELAGKPIDRALYRLFAELVGSGARVGDVGCGPGHVTAHLAELGLDAVGVDPSSGMLAAARHRHPTVSFHLGSFTDLGELDRAWSGAVAPYSLIHVAAADRPAAYRELARVIRPEGWLLVAFHLSMADQPPGSTKHVEEWWDQDVDLDFHFLEAEEVIDGLSDTGFSVVSRTEREPWPDEAQSRRCYLIARRD